MYIYSQMQQHVSKYFARGPLPHPPPDPGGMVIRSKFNLFQNMVMLYIKFNVITNAAT